ncbi:MAG: amidohydrolase family protein [Spirochaetes bacterium]|nr:amidohydrolase family protein [Spirochaetota bacterium]MBN2769990.1 amidohydrolase family protein [Spirochaetota bacterium]
MKKWAIESDVLITPGKPVTKGKIVINNGVIEDVTSRDANSRMLLTIKDGIISPGLINSHDHLMGSYYPKVGNGPYENWLPWDNDLKSAPVYEERQQIANRDLYLIGSYRNLLSGVTSVQDHIPHFVQEPYLDILPIKLISDFAIAHSIASFALNWGGDIQEEYAYAAANSLPFITHIAEGFDDETRSDLQTLKSKKGFGPNSVLVHGIAFSEQDISEIASVGASVVWCADSNMFMFNKTANVREMLAAGVNVCIGTDSPMSGGLNILHEMRYCKKVYNELYQEELPCRQIVKMVTENPGKAFFLDSGRIEKGMLADITVFRNQGGDPYESIVNASLADVRLVVIEGMPVYGDAEFAEVFAQQDIEVQHVVVDGSEKVVIGNLTGLLDRVNRAVGFNKKFPFLPVAEA